MRSSHHPEILRKPAGSKSQPLATFTRPVRGDVVRLSGAVGLMYPKRDSFEGGEPEIATAKFREFIFYELR